jgi:hypothetical protein
MRRPHRKLPACSPQRSLHWWACLALLAFQAFFLTIVVPGHLRGAVTLTGTRAPIGLSELGLSAAGACPMCCASDAPQDGARPNSPAASKNHAPTSKDRSECAICHIAAALMVPPAIELAPAMAPLRSTEAAAVSRAVPLLRARMIRQDRAPPRAA